jgi:raffinose/stachyose/melibiose transport system permease protein
MTGHILRRRIVKTALFIFLTAYALSILYPIFLMLLTSFKTTREIFTNPFGFPASLDFSSYIKLFTISNYLTYFKNSLFVTLISLLIILVVTSMASFVLAKYEFKLKKFLYMFFVIGMIIPIRLGTISILRLMIGINANDTLFSVIIVGIAVGIPFGIFVLTDFIKMIPEELSAAARVDGCTEPSIFRIVIIPLLRPALATVAIINYIPLWNDFWFPLIFLKSDNVKTVPLATALLFGQYQTNYSLVFAVLSMASIPVMLFYILFSKQFVKGLSSGALKG